MTGGTAGGPPTPSVMPSRRRVLATPAPARPPAPAGYAVAAEVPRRGWPAAVSWPDTGVLLSLGTDAATRIRFVAHFGSRCRLTRTVANELRGISNGPPGTDKQRAADAAVRAVVLPRALTQTDLEDGDLGAFDAVVAELRALSDDPDASHKGEASIVVCADRDRTRAGGRHVVLTNDGGASHVARAHGLPSRHTGDAIAEMSCATPGPTPAQCWSTFRAASRVAAVPRDARPSDEDYFRCQSSNGSCGPCDTLP